MQTINFILKHKKLIGALVIVVIVLIFLFPKNKKPEENTQPDLPPLKVVDSIPKPGEYTSYFSDERITFVFNKPIDKSTIKYSVSPEPGGLKLIIDENKPNEIALFPFDGWKAGVTYKITLNKSISATDGATLEDDITGNYTRIRPKETPGLDLEENFSY